MMDSTGSFQSTLMIFQEKCRTAYFPFAIRMLSTRITRGAAGLVFKSGVSAYISGLKLLTNRDSVSI